MHFWLGRRRNLFVLLWIFAVTLATIPLSIYGIPTGIVGVSPTPANLTNLSVNYFVANFTFVEVNPSACLLDYHNGTEANYTMSMQTNATGGYCELNVSGQQDGDRNYSIYVNDTDNNWTWNGTWFLTIDTTFPAPRIHLPANTTHNTTSLQLNFSYNETNPDSCWYEYNNINMTLSSCANDSFTALDDQESTLTLYMNDTAGNMNSTNVTFTVDTNYPAPKIYLPANTTYNTTALTLNFSYTEINADSCWFDHNGTNTTIPGCTNYSFTAADDQATTLLLYMNDTADNLNSTNATFTVDTTFPINVSLTSPTAANDTNISTTYAVINFTFIDSNPNICLLDFYNGTEANYSMTIVPNSTGGYCWLNLTGQPDGRWNYTVYVNDSAGNMNSSGLYSNWFEAQLPTVTIYIPSNTTYNSTTVKLNYSVFDGIGVNMTWHQYNGSNTTLGGNTTFTALANISSNLTLWANDSFGNLNSTTVYFSTDTQAPSLTVLTPATGLNTSASRTNFTFNVTDNLESFLGCNLTVNGSVVNSSTFANGTTGWFYNNYSEGTHTWNVTCWDNASRAVSSGRSLTYDNTVPAAVLSLPANTTYSSGTNLALNYTSSDTNLNATYYSMDNWTNYTLSGNTTFNASEGVHYIYFHANDSAGNANSTRRDFTVDLSAPIVESISPAAGATWSSSSTVTFTYNVSDLAIKNCTLVINPASDENTTSVVVNATQSFTKTLGNAAYTWYVSCYDNANRVNSSSSRALTVSYSSGTAGSSGTGDSGAGGGETTAAQPAKASKSWDTIPSDAPAEMSISNDEIPLTNIKIEASETMQSVSLTVEALASKPSEVSAPSGQVYKYLKLDAPDVNESRTKSITINFKVTKSWMSSNTIDEKSVTLNRYTSGAWTKLPTEQTGNTSTHYLYKATATGFSYFSISGEKKPVICTAGDKRCYNDTVLETCSQDGTDWTPRECQYGCDNETKACFSALTGACTAGEMKCQGKGLWKCENSTWTFETMCTYGCSGNACALGTAQMLWYAAIIGAVAACAALIVILFWHEKVHHVVKPGQPAKNPIRQGSFSLYNPLLLREFRRAGEKVMIPVRNPFTMPLKPKKLRIKKPKGKLWLRGRLRKWE